MLIINPAIPRLICLGTSGRPILDGFAVIFGGGCVKIAARSRVAGLVASFTPIIFAYGDEGYT